MFPRGLQGMQGNKKTIKNYYLIEAMIPKNKCHIVWISFYILFYSRKLQKGSDMRIEEN